VKIAILNTLQDLDLRRKEKKLRLRIPRFIRDVRSHV